MEFVMPTLRELFSLDGKVALVTGGAGYLGLAMSEALAELGARVAIASRNLEKCQEAAARLGPEHLAPRLDIASADSIRAVVREVIERTGRLDVLVNNAYSGPVRSIEEADEHDFEVSLRNGVTAYYVAAKAAWEFMRDHGGGSIINIASMYGVVASYPDAYTGFDINSPPNYHALKGGLVHLTRHLAAYWAKDGVRVNAISPGPFPSPRVKDAMPEFIQRLEAKTPLGRMGLPHELKGVVLLLASDAGSYITGQNILVDGGWTIW